ncbi:MAG: radical SAM protein [Prevotellaceae bacterium]|jgi:wyosine [tRNA(Phe)-imidazoG37] synthetase (radical SAM superfamily)|nr:radical SAM protein [Prevotellaceae bacterium]
MSTFLFEGIVFGPIKSRRLGISLGINLLPKGNKLCNFNCIYCECGWNKINNKNHFHSRNDVKEALETKLIDLKKQGVSLDTITFSGNGEPTMYPEFAGIIDDTIELRNQHFPDAKVSVLSNGTLVHHEAVFNALKKVGRAILKLDSAIDATVKLMNNPQFDYSVSKVIDRFKAFNGNMVLQTMFLRGNYDGNIIDNTTEHEIRLWLDTVKQINPKEIMIYTIDRETPAKGLEKIPLSELEQIADRARLLGYTVQVSG